MPPFIKRAFLILLAFKSGGALARSEPEYNRWLPIATSATGAVTRFDAETYEWDGTIAKVWIDTDYSKDKTKSARSLKSRMEIDCSSKRLRTIQAVIYAPDGTTSSQPAASEEAFSAAVPDTIGEAIVRGVCSFVRIAPYGVEPAH